MSTNYLPCHGTFACLATGSRPWRLSGLFHLYQKLHSYLRWYVENTGVAGVLKHALSLGPLRGRRNGRTTGRPGVASGTRGTAGSD